MIKHTLAAAAAFFVALPGLFAVPRQATAAPPCPTVIGHRAGASLAPENTVAGIKATAAAGAPMVEMDVRWSAGANTQASPGYPVLMHDATLDRTTNGTGQVSDSGLVAMTKLLAQDYAPWKTDPRFKDAHVPFAGDFVPASADAGVGMLLDVKVTPTEFGGRKLIEYVDRRSYRQHLIYMAAPASVTAMRTWFPDLTYAVIEYPPAGRVYTPDYLRSLGASIYAVPWPAVSPALVGYMHAAGVRVFAWTSDRPGYDVAGNWAALHGAGVDAIITNEPAAALSALGCSAAAP